jgi:preprotein translocase subunit SecA
MSNNLRIEIARAIFRFEIVAPQQTLQQLLQQGVRLERNRSLFGDVMQSELAFNQSMDGEEDSDEEDAEEGRHQGDTDDEQASPVVAGARIGRNELCPCGSGKKYKKCCYAS